MLVPSLAGISSLAAKMDAVVHPNVSTWGAPVLPLLVQMVDRHAKDFRRAAGHLRSAGRVRLAEGSNPVRMGSQANMGRAVSTQVVFVRSELATLGGDSLELLLGWSVGVSNVHHDGAIHIRLDLVVVKLRDDLITDVAGLEARFGVRIASSMVEEEKNGDRQRTGQIRPHGCCPCYLAESCSTEWYNQKRWTRVPVGMASIHISSGSVSGRSQRLSGILTISFICLGKLEMYRLVDASSPSAFRRELKDSCKTTLVIG